MIQGMENLPGTTAKDTAWSVRWYWCRYCHNMGCPYCNPIWTTPYVAPLITNFTWTIGSGTTEEEDEAEEEVRPLRPEDV